MNEGDVIAFLDWLTAGNYRMEYAVYNPHLNPDQKPDFYRNGERVTVEQMDKWANNWLEDTGLESTGPARERLVREALQKVLEDHVYPRTH